MTATKTTTAKKSRVRVRTYRHGLGDCHLLSFAKPDGSQLHLLIDCGVVSRTQNPGPLMTAVAKDIAEQTGKTLDVVVATHQHTDHLSGFKQADAVFRVGNIEMKRLWLAWTEDPRNPLGKKIQRELVRKLAAVRAAAAKLTALDHAVADRVRSGTWIFLGRPQVMHPRRRQFSMRCKSEPTLTSVILVPATSSLCLKCQMCASMFWVRRPIRRS